ncbi:MAG TPA: N-acetylornithine carbamoyltransferase [Saprospiraceae bacterium]|nr:N-acetylornithine carbamoyltransferase [Saprospiraceae bacterium]
MKQFTSIHDVSNLHQLIQSAIHLKKNPFAHQELGKQKTLGMLFFNPSLRTRWSTQKAAANLGMQVISMNATQGWAIEFEEAVPMNTNKAEHIKEAAKVLSQYCDILAVRSFPTLTDRTKDYQDFVLNQLLKFATVPIISMESAIRHPLQSLTDLITIEEHKKTEKPKIVLSWAPHPKALPQAVSNSFAEWILAAGYDLTITHPHGYELSEEFTKGAKIEYNQSKAFEGADFIYAKNWSSFNHYGKILTPKENWIINQQKMALTNDGKFMHCLPVRRNVVVSDAVIDSKNSLVIAQANNRTFAAQAVLQNVLVNAVTKVI